MGLQDRPYWREDFDRGPGRFGGFRLGLPKPTRAALGVIIVCTVLYLVTGFAGEKKWALYAWLSLRADRAHELWRFVTFQFMHGDAGHFLWNMVAIYFFMAPIERAWGIRKVLVFYLICGAFGGGCFLLMTLIWPGAFGVPLIGASGGALACLMACAILFPQIIVLIFPIRWVAAFLVVLYLLSTAFDKDLSDAAHLGGMIAAGLWIWGLPRLRQRLSSARTKRSRGAWERKLKRQADEQAEIDRILEKIHQQGIGSLSAKEKRTLRNATRQQQKEEHDLYRL